VNLLSLPPLSLYVHVPWCVRKCPYCDFNSHAQRDQIPEQAYLQALFNDLETELAAVQGRALHSIFIGGGTPSLLSADFYRKLLQGIAARIELSVATEITLEANPGTFEQVRFEGFLQAGINRLSLGIQSFDDDALQALGRIHRGREAVAAVEQARAIGFERINLDLMHGLPGQTPERAMDDLRQGLALVPNHLSWYQLTIEPNTEFYRRPPELPADDKLWAIQEQGQALLAGAGFEQYEISGYSRPDQQCRHNLNYWRFGDYLGIGAGAHGKWTDLEGGQLYRRSKPRQPKAYLQAYGGDQPLAQQQLIEPEDLPLEFMMNVLRLSAGVESSLFAERTGWTLAQIRPQLQQARRLGLLGDDPARLQPTLRGRRFLNDLLGLFVGGRAGEGGVCWPALMRS
jgi:oxygen-independent coproporphyrinogen-3 oxidase